MNVRNNNLYKNLVNSRFGKALCRLAGEEKGLVFMEYAIMGILVAASVCFAAAILGTAIGNAFDALCATTVGDATAAMAIVTAGNSQVVSDIRTAQIKQNSVTAGAGSIAVATVSVEDFTSRK